MTVFDVIPYIILFLFGITIGSFLNVCIYRIPEKKDIVKLPSHCMHCGYRLKWYDNVPLLSYIFLKGKCRKCKEKISLQYPIIEALNGILWCMAYAVYGFSIQTLFACALFSVLVVISVIDWRTYEIPLGCNIFILILGLIHLATDIANWKLYVIGLFAIGVPLAILYYATKGRGIGGGDVKLMGACGLLLGWKLALLGFVLGCILGAVIHLIRMKVSKADHVLAMGPYLSAGLWIAVMFGEQIIAWYLALYA